MEEITPLHLNYYNFILLCYGMILTSILSSSTSISTSIFEREQLYRITHNLDLTPEVSNKVPKDLTAFFLGIFLILG